MAEEHKRLKKVTTGEAYVRKESRVKEFLKFIFVTDAEHLWTYAKEQIIKPFMKKGIVDFATNIVNMAVYGTPKSSNNQDYNYQSPYFSNMIYNPANPYISYNSLQAARGLPSPTLPEKNDVGFKFDLMAWDTEQDARNVLIGLKNEMIENGVVSVAGYYELWNDNITVPYTYNEWGWAPRDFEKLGDDPAKTGDGKWYVPLPNARPISKMT